MPQEKKYTLDLNDSTTIEFNPAHIPAGFDTLSQENQKAVLHQIVKNQISALEKEKSATASDIIVPLILVLILAFIVLFFAKKIRDNPKLYDRLVKLDGKPNPNNSPDEKTG